MRREKDGHEGGVGWRSGWWQRVRSQSAEKKNVFARRIRRVEASLTIRLCAVFLGVEDN